MTRKKGVLITLEGNEGCGKSTQIGLLARALRRRGKKVFVTREPGGTRVSDAIRSVLLDNRHRSMTGVCETLLYMASRAQLIAEVVKPRLEKGFVVLCDRWLDATVAYQGFGEGVDIGWIRTLGREVTQGIAPDLSLYIDIPVRVGLARAKKRRSPDRMEKKDIVFHERVRRGYLHIAKTEGRRFKRIEAREHDSSKTIHERIQKAVHCVL